MNSFLPRIHRWPARLSPASFSLLLFVATASGPHLNAKTSQWKDVQGTSFRGEPMEVIGPNAVFKTGSLGGRRVLLRGISADDCRRVYAEIAKRPARAATWAAAQGLATSDVVGHVLQFDGKDLVPADLTKMPEPQLLLVLFGSHNDGESWAMVGATLAAVYHRVQRVYPGLLGAVFMGIRHNEAEHRRMAIASRMPWLVAKFQDQAGMQLKRFVPAEGTKLVLLSREGVPLLSARATDRDAMREFADRLVEFLWQIDPLNPRHWRDRAAYFSAIRPTEFARSGTEPMLIGNPLRAETLREYGVTRVAARLEIAADGKVVPTIHSTAAEMPPELVAPLTGVLRQTLVLPAIDHGVPVAGGLDYLLDVPSANPSADADVSWLRSTDYPVISINEWLLLRPIKVSEEDFVSTIESETPSGTVVFKALQVSDAKVSRAAQMTAFNTNWFDPDGAASVQPKEGAKQQIGETALTWERVKADNGYVNLQRGLVNLDYTVGYAWAEFDAPAAGKAWLGLGSDDGVKIWLNGALVHDKWIRRPSRIDDDVVPLQLKAGKNQILLKIQNATGEWSFLQRIRTAPTS